MESEKHFLSPNKRLCSRCAWILPLDDFYLDKRRGRPRSLCKRCHVMSTGRRKRLALGEFGTRTSVCWNNARHRAHLHGLDFTITLEWVREKTSLGVCAVTGIPFRLVNDTKYRQNPFAPSLDRINPQLGYTPENTRVVLCAYNLMRNEYDDALIHEVFLASLSGRCSADLVDRLRNELRNPPER